MTTASLALRMRDRVPAQAVLQAALDAPSADLLRAAKTQRQVAALLAHLPAGWTVLHSLPRQDADGAVDHLAIGPAGVFPIADVGGPGRRLVVRGRVLAIGRRRSPAVLTAEADAERVGRLLAAHRLGVVPVHPTVVVQGALRLRVVDRPRGVAVVPASALRARLVGRPAVLEPEDVAAAVDLLDSPARWGDAPDAPADLLQRYSELEAQGRGARR